MPQKLLGVHVGQRTKRKHTYAKMFDSTRQYHNIDSILSETRPCKVVSWHGPSLVPAIVSKHLVVAIYWKNPAKCDLNPGQVRAFLLEVDS